MPSFVYGLMFALAVSIWTSPCECSKGLRISIITNGSYSIGVDDVTWLTSGSTVFNSEGKNYSTADKSLKLVNTTGTSGNDFLGQWQSINFTYQAGKLVTYASIKTYNVPDRPLVIFSQQYLTDAEGTSAGGPDLLISQYPSFQMSPQPADLGYVAFAGDMAGWNGLTRGKWDPTTSIPTGIEGGPLILFDNSSNAIVISPLSEFMAASNHIEAGKQISWGIMGLVESVPKDYRMDFILYYSDKGINDAMRGWGEVLQQIYRKSDVRRESDTTLENMGYWTDNGAYYYYNTEAGKNYQDTVIDTVHYIRNQTIPFQYMQYDSWWYLKGHRQGTKTWTPTKDVFPDGFQYVSEKTVVPFGCHNRYWDSETTYAKYNGGKYNFIQDKGGLAVPDDAQFWKDLFYQAIRWGQFVFYEQDWLNVETDHNVILLKDLSLGRRWLKQMGDAADYWNIKIQYCMAYSRHILQSLEVPAVTQARVSEDYSPGTDQWKIGVTSMFADAVNLAPFKDTFWTTEKQPGNPYNRTEPYTRLNHVIATLSTGPVGPGDGIGYINKTLLMKCCNHAGRILKPSKPATAIDDQIKRLVFKDYPGPDGEVYTTYSSISDLTFGIALAADMKNDYSLRPSAGWPHFPVQQLYAYSVTNGIKTPVVFSEADPIKFGRQCSKTNFCLFHTSPLLAIASGEKFVLMGEIDKWVPLSYKRVLEIDPQEKDIVIYLNVEFGETVTFTFFDVVKGTVESIVCDNSKKPELAYQSYISLVKKTCTLSS